MANSKIVRVDNPSRENSLYEMLMKKGVGVKGIFMEFKEKYFPYAKKAKILTSDDKPYLKELEDKGCFILNKAEEPYSWPLKLSVRVSNTSYSTALAVETDIIGEMPDGTFKVVPFSVFQEFYDNYYNKRISEYEGYIVGFKYDSRKDFRFIVNSSYQEEDTTIDIPYNVDRPKEFNVDAFMSKKVKITVELINKNNND